MRKYVKYVVGIAAAVAVVGWWLVARPAPHPARPGSGARAVGTAPASGDRPAPGGRAAPVVRGTDPAEAWGDAPGAAGARAVAVAFAETLITPVPGTPPSATASRFRQLVTPSLAARLVASPGAPALAGAGSKRSIVSAAATIDDWAPPGAGVAVTLSIRSGTAAPAVLGLDLHEVDTAGRWQVDEVDL